MKIAYMRLMMLLVLMSVNASLSASSLDSLLRLLDHAKDTNMVEVYSEIGLAYLKKKDFENSKKYFRKGYDLSSELKYEYGQIGYYHHLGLLYSKVINYDSSKFYFNKALQSKLYQSRPDSKFKLLNDYGSLFYYSGRYKEALKIYFEALSDTTTTNEAIKLSVYNNLGNCYYFLSDFNKALEYYEKTLSINKKQGDKLKISYSLGNIALIYYEKGEYEKSLSYSLESYKVQKELKDTSEMAASLINIGLVYQQQKKYDKLLEVTLESLRLRKLLNEPRKTVVALTHAGFALHLNKRDKEAIEFLEEAFKTATELKLNRSIQESSKYLYLIFKENKKPEKALSYMEVYKNYSDTIYNANYAKAIADAQEKYESTERERELMLLQKDQVIKQIALDKNKKMLWGSILLLTLLAIMFLLLYNQYHLKRKSNNLLESQNRLIMAQKDEITDSIKYSSVIQSAILPPDKDILQVFPNYFKYYKPKDIVSGDFYWIGYKDDLKIIVVADCTGHGVPGAMMSMIGINLLNHAVYDKNLCEVQSILEFMDSNIAQLLRQNLETSTAKHSMDLSVCIINSVKKQINYGGSMNSIYYFNESLQILKTDKIPLGYNHNTDKKAFNSFYLNYQPGNRLYLFTDGIPDQFGGPNNKKLLSKKIQQFLIEVQPVKIAEQYSLLASFIEKWQGSSEQTDDMTLIGIELS